MRATTTVACPYCGAETKVTIGTGREVTDVTKDRAFVFNVLDEESTTATGCSDGHRFYVKHVPETG